MKKIILFCIFVFSILITKNAFSNWELKTFSNKTWFPWYEEQVKNVCDVYNRTDKNNEKIINLPGSRNFKNLDNIGFTNDLAEAKKIYNQNMDDIFECAILWSYIRNLKTVEEAIKNNEKLKKSLWKKIEQKIKSLEEKLKEINGCKKPTNNLGLVKKYVLEQTTYETCKYDFYLKYLKNRSGTIENSTNLENLEDNEKILTKTIVKNINERNSAIDKEIERIFEVYPIVMQSFDDYENYIWIHILLELLEQDLKVFKVWLHKTLNPINQVIYKIHNAMKY